MANYTKTVQMSSQFTSPTIDRDNLTQENAVKYAIPLTDARIHDNMASVLTNTANSDDAGLITGTPGTDATTIQGVDFGGTSTDEKFAVEFALPPEYTAGQPITVRVRAAMLVVSDGTATVDVECWRKDTNGGVGGDLCTTAAQSINSATPADKDFTITPTSRVPGDVLIIRVSFAGSDSGNAAPLITPEVQELSVLLGIKG